MGEVVNWSHLTVFDLDKTIVSDNCSLEFCRYLVAKKVLPYSSLLYSFFYYAQHILFKTSLTDLHNKVFKHHLRGKSLELIEANVGPFLEGYLHSKFYLPVLSQLRLAQHLGYYTLILSNSPSFLVEKVAKFLGVNEWRATEYAVDEQLNLSHIASIMQGEDKALCVKEVAGKLDLGKEKITAFSDSFLDLPLLLTAGTPVAVNPDSELLKFSQKMQWAIL